jgi:hypothetical protein
MLKKRTNLRNRISEALSRDSFEDLRLCKGPVAELVEAIETLGLRYLPDEPGIVLCEAEVINFDLTTIDSASLATRLQSLATRQLITHLRNRCEADRTLPPDHTPQQRQGRRDMMGIDTELDLWSNRVLLDDRPKYSKAHVDRIPALAKRLTPEQKGRIESIQTGSLRTNHRLQHVPGLEANRSCKFCGALVEDAQHMFWQCPL